MPGILVTKDNLKYRSWEPFWEKMSQNGWDIFAAKIKKRPAGLANARHIFLVLPETAGRKRNFLVMLLLPAIWAVNGFLLRNRRHNIRTLVLTSPTDKLCLTMPAHWLGIKAIWITQLNSALPVFSRCLTRLSKYAVVTCFSENDKNSLDRSGWSNLRHLPLGAPQKGLKHQENIFEKMAQTSRQNGRKFFSLATIADLDSRHNLELIFHAIKQALTIANDLQLVVIGDGAERQKLKWLARKIGVESQIWFVGEQKILHKWLQNADVYLSCAKTPGHDDCYYAFYAAAAGLPLLLPDNPVYEEFFQNGHNALFFRAGDQTKLSQTLIELKQKPSLRAKLSREAGATVDKEHTLAKMLEEFQGIINDG